MKKIQNILKNIKFDNKNAHFVQQIIKNANTIKNKNNYFCFLENKYDLDAYIYKNINEGLESDFNILYQLSNNLTGVVFYEYVTNSISLFIDSSISTSYDEHISVISEINTSKGWNNKYLETDIKELILYINKHLSLIIDIHERYNEDYLKSIFIKKKELS